MSGDVLLVVAAAVALLLAGLWIPFVVGGAAIALILVTKGVAGLKAVGLVSWSSSNSFTLTAIPLFILMAEVLLRSGLAGRLYRGLAALTRRLPGGLLQTNVIGCAVFSAISGSSVATAAALGTVAIPELERRGYRMRMAYGSLAAGGTLGILIPPSIAMIVFGTFTDTSIIRLFAAGLLPGLCLTLAFCVFIAAFGRAPAPVRPAAEAATVAGVVADVAPVGVPIVLVLCSLYLGWATPTEAAAVGCVLACAMAAAFGDLSPAAFSESLHRTIRSSASILFIVVTAFLFSYAIVVSGISAAVTQFILGLQLDRAMFLVAIALVYIVLGLFIESIAMMVITVPLLVPALTTYGVDPVWFGVFLVILVELGQITPPFGLNLFVIQGVRGAAYGDVVMGSLPYYAILLGFLGVLSLFPALALWLPGLL